MNIIVVGSGKVGCTLAEQLTAEGHDITIIDIDPLKLQNISEVLDVLCVVGNGTSYHVQKEAGVEKADLLIAVTNHDEINMLSCLIAKKAGNCKTIARVRNPEYYQDIGFIKEELGLSMAINPEKAAAAEMARLIQFPSAIEVDTFAKGRVNLLRFCITENSILNGLKLSESSQKIGNDALICIVERNNNVIIPDGNVTLYANDIISIIIPLQKVSSFFKKIGIKSKAIHSVMLAGGGTTSYYLSEILLKTDFRVKIIEPNRDRCVILSELLPKALIINGNTNDQRLLSQEGIEDIDAFVSLTDTDEENILISLYTNKISNARLITKIDNISFEEIVNTLPIGITIYPKNITAEYIIKYVRSMQNTNSSNVETLYRMVDNKVEAIEFIVGQNSTLTNIPLERLKTKDNLLVCSIIRKGATITPNGQNVLKPGDNVIVVTTHLGLSDITDILETGIGNK